MGLLVLVVSVAVVGSSVVPSLEAQDKSKTKAKEKEKVGTIEIYKAKDGYRYRIKGTDGKVMAMPSHARESKEEVAKDLEDIKATLNKVKPSEVSD
jgi:hypothetical protein